jgi:hypothetical protein
MVFLQISYIQVKKELHHYKMLNHIHLSIEETELSNDI